MMNMNVRILGGTVTVKPGTYNLTATLMSDSTPLHGKTITFYSSGDGVTWSVITKATTDSNGNATVSVSIKSNTYYKAEFVGDDQYDPSSDTVYVQVQQPSQGTGLSLTNIPIWLWILILFIILAIGLSRRGE